MSEENISFIEVFTEFIPIENEEDHQKFGSEITFSGVLKNLFSINYVTKNVTKSKL
jgi:hypothetical protein